MMNADAVRRSLFIAFALTLSCALAPSVVPIFEAPVAAAQKTVKVKEYTRKDGTVVKAHERSGPERRATATPKLSRPECPSAFVSRDEQGRIQRSAAARHAFAQQTG